MSLFLLFGLLLFLQHAGHAEAGVEPVIEIIPSNGALHVIEGETASLWCKVTQGDPPPTVTWVKGPDNTPVGEGEELKFDRVKLEDDCGYRCHANSSVASKTGSFTVDVYKYDTKTVFTSSNVKIDNLHGKTGIKLTWYNTNLMAGDSVDDKYKVAEWLVLSGSSANVKPGYDVDNKTGDLLIPSVTLDHEGWYTAFMMVPMGENMYNYTDVVVYGMPSGVVMEGLPNPVNESVEQTITCTVPVVRPKNVTFIWSRSGSVIKNDEPKITENRDTFEVISTLKYTFSRGMDGDILNCSVGFKRFPDDWVSAEKEINITYPYNVTTKQVDGTALPVRGQNMSLICSTVDEGKPLSTDYSWYVNNSKTPLQDDDKYSGSRRQEMTIKNLEVQDAGLYECRLRNDAGYSQTEDVYNLEKVLYIPSVKMECPQPVNETGTLVLNCDVIEGEPEVEEDNIKWYYNDDDGLLTNKGKILEVKNITRLQRGKYSCDASNDIGKSKRADCEIDVYYGPAGMPSVEIEKPIIAIKEEAKLICDTSNVEDRGNPQAEHYIWQKDSQNIPNDKKSHTLKPAFITESGNYFCALKNGYGNTSLSSAAKLIVEAPVMIEDEQSEWLFEPMYNDSSFIIQYNVSGTSEMTFCLTNSSKDVSETYFTLMNKTVVGDFLYGQKEAQHVSLSWKLLDEYTSCSNMTFFNGNYTFEAIGTLVDSPSKQNRTFTINVQYPAIWKFPERRESSALGQPKTLHCDVCAEPPPTEYSWNFMGNISMNVTGPHLNISNVTSEDIGWYTCTVVNMIKEMEYQQTFNITLEEKGSPHSPTVFGVISNTAKTLLLEWRVGFDGGYDLEWFELVYTNATDGESSIKVTDCIENKICEHRIENLEPNSTYRLKIRAKNKRPDGEAYSNFEKTEGTTKFLPQVNILTEEITETYIHVKWEYKDAYQNKLGDGDVGIAVKYKDADVGEDFKRFPEDKVSTIPASDQSAKIPGEFDTTHSYEFEYSIYEGSELSDMRKKKSENGEDKKPGGTNPGIIAGAVIGGIVFLILVSFFVILWIRRAKVKRPAEAHTGMDGSGNGAPLNQELIHETGFGPSEQPQYEEVAKPGDRSSKPDIAPKPKPRKGNTDSTHSAKSGVDNGGFENGPETTDYVNVGPVKKGTENDREAAPNTEAHGGGKQKRKPKPAKRPKPSKDKRGTSSQHQPDTNPSEELIYADLGFDNDKSDKKEKKKKAAPEKGPEEIIGAENMTDYADLDFEQMKTPDRSPPAQPEQPLPSEPMYANMENDGSLV